MAAVGGVKKEYRWRWVSFSTLPERYGHPCKYVWDQRNGYGHAGARTTVEFPDGLQVITARTNIKQESRYLSNHNRRGPQSLQHLILVRIRRSPDRVFTPEDFFDLAPAVGGVGQSLSRLVECRAIFRVGRGQYKSRLPPEDH
jgi:hypothetical protein